MWHQFETFEDKKRQIKAYVVSILLILILGFVAYFYNKSHDVSRLDKLKQDKKKKIVYSQLVKKNGSVITEVPCFNLNMSEIDQVNKEILDFANSYLTNDKNSVSYTFDINNQILSLVLKVVYYDKTYFVAFRTYNINLEDMRVLSEEEVKEQFKVTDLDVENKIKERFEFFFQDEQKVGVLDNECDYDCFLFMRGGKSYLDDISYYIKDNKLYVYKAFHVQSVYDEEDYFTKDDFLIEICE